MAIEGWSIFKNIKEYCELSINAAGNGDVVFNAQKVRNNNALFTLNAEDTANVQFVADNGYRLKSVKLNNVDITSSIVNNQYTINANKAEIELEIIFEPIPSYSLKIVSSGNGSATYNGTAVRAKTQTFTINEGTSATVTFTPDASYRIASVKLNGSDVTANVVNNQYTIGNISSDTTLEVIFEADSPVISFADANVKAICIANWDTNGDGELSEAEAAMVTDIGSAFCNNQTITSLNDLKYFTSLRSFKEEAFSHCSNLTSIFIPKSVTFIGLDAFAGCSNLKKVIVSDIAAFCNIEFEKADDSYGNPISFAHHLYKDENTEYTELTLPETVKSIPDYAFDECYSFTKIYLPNSITVIGDGAFGGCKNVKSVVLSNSLTAIPPFAFRDCTSLESVEIPYGVKNIGLAAFRGCTALTSVVLPKSLTSLNYTHNGYVESNGGAFENCSKLSFVKSNIYNPFVINSLTFKGISTSAVLEVPQNTKSLYLNKKWMNYFHKIKELSVYYYVLSISSSAHGVVYCNNEINDAGTYFASENSKVTIKIEPDTNYRLKKLLVNNEDVTNLVDDNQYILNNIASRMTIKAEFEEIPVYSLTLIAIGNGNVGYEEAIIRNQSQSYTVREGTSITASFAPDAGFRIASVKVNGADVTASVANNMYTISSITANTTLAVTFEAIPPTTYTFNITASGNGYVAYDGNSIRGKTSSFSLEEGSNAVLKFSADEGNRLKSVKVNGQDVTATIVNNQYTINNITADINVEVVFEAIPTYSLNIVASGNGNAEYNGTTIRNQSRSFTLQEGSSATISITPDANYRIKSVKVNNTDVTSQVANGQITISNIKQETNVEVLFEEIPPTTYSLTITVIGNGAITYDGNSIRGGSSTFTVVEGSYVTVQISADDGYRLKRVAYNGNDVTASAVSGRFTTDKITANSTLVVEFEAIPTFSLTIKSSAFGSVKYGDAIITNQTETFTVREGTSAVLTFVPDGNGRLQHVTLNGADITGELKNGQYTISDIRADQSVEAEYVEDITKVTDAGVAYTVTSYDEGTVVVAAGNYGQVLTVPASFTAKGKTWTVIGIDDDALTNATELAAIIWEPEVPFTAQVSNPNLLLYVKKAEYSATTIQNVVVNDLAENIVLVEAENGNNFYCPKTFTAKHISYEHNYSMISGYNDCQGWETLVLPFDVSMMINAKGTELVPYSTWKYGSNLRPFWLYQLTENGWQTGEGIKANVPYIISMPNNEMYESSYNLTGNIEFVGNNVQVMASNDMNTGRNGNKRFVANYQNQAASTGIYALNVSNEWCQNIATEKEGSTFIRSLRNVHPFEAYMTMEGSNARAIPVFDNATDVRWLMEEVRGTMAEDAWYDLQGRKLQGEPKQNGIYIYKGKKVKK